MRRFLVPLSLFATLAFLATMIACGGNASPSPAATTPPATTPPTSGGTTTPPSTGGGTGGSTSVNNDTVYEAAFVSQTDRMVHGSVTIDADGPTGNGTFSFTGQAPNSAYTVRLCDPVTVCTTALTSGTTDSTGSAHGSFRVQPANQFGSPYETDPIVVDMGGTYALISAWSAVDSTSKYSTPLFRSSDGSASGRVTINGNAVHLQLQNADANTDYQIAMRLQFGTRGGQQFGTFKTDANGKADVNLTVPQTGTGIGIARIDSSNGGFIDGFRTR